MQSQSSQFESGESTTAAETSSLPWPVWSKELLRRLAMIRAAMPAIDRCVPGEWPADGATPSQARRHFGVADQRLFVSSASAGYDFWMAGWISARLMTVVDGHGGLEAFQEGERIPFDAVHAIDGAVRFAPLVKRHAGTDLPAAEASLAELRSFFDMEADVDVDRWIASTAFAGLHVLWFGPDSPPLSPTAATLVRSLEAATVVETGAAEEPAILAGRSSPWKGSLAGGCGLVRHAAPTEAPED